MFRIEKSRRKAMIGIGIIVIAIGLFLYWENYGREQFTYSEVIILNQSLEPNDKVKSEMLEYIKIDKRNIIEESIVDPAEIINKEAACYIPKGLQLCPKFFTDRELNPGNGKYILEIPSDWLYAYPQTLRRGDKVYFHTVKAISNNEYRNIDPVKLQNFNEPAQPEQEENKITVLESTIAYVKDSSNREVIDIVPDRMDGSASIAKVEIITDNEGYETLKSYINSGYQYVIMYE